MPAHLRPSTLPAFLCSLRSALGLMLVDAEEAKWSRCIRIATVHGAYRMDMVVDANPGRVEGRRAPPSRPRVTGSHLPGADRIEDRPAGQLQRAGPQARPATAHEQTSHLHGPSIGGESSGAQEGGELGRPEVGRHRRCGGMDRGSTLSGSATRAWRSLQDEHLTGARLPDPDLATKIRIP